MDQERQEVYERIPWETLEKKGGDRQWLVMAVAGAIAIGALAYSFMKNQPAAVPAQTVAAAPIVPPTVGTVQVPPTTMATSPVVVSEADLYAIDPARLADEVAAHAEWFAVEYFSVDGSEESKLALSSLLPSGVPGPEAPEGVQVFVDWVRTGAVTEIAPLTYQVEVMVRSLMAQGDTAFVRQPPRVATITVTIGEDGQPRVATAPVVEVKAPATPATTNLSPVPAEIQTQVESTHGSVLGGLQLADGSWSVVVMVTGVDGVRRPETVIAP